MEDGRREHLGWTHWRQELHWKEPVDFVTPKEQIGHGNLGPRDLGGGVGCWGEIGEKGVGEAELQGGQDQLELYSDLDERREHLG